MNLNAAARTRSVRTAVSSIPAAQRRVAAAVAIAVAGDQLLDPTRTHLPLCPLHALTGLWCPFCGTLRSAFELTRLHLRTAAHDNVLLLAAVPLLAAWWINAVVRSRQGKRPRRVHRLTGPAVVVVLVIFTVLRNLPIGVALRAG